MANQGSTFPLYFSAVYKEGDAFPALMSEAQRTASRLRGTFDSAFAGIGKTVADSLTMPRMTGGILDLKPERLRAAADAAAAEASALRDVADAARRVALSDPSPVFAKQAAEARGASLAADEVSKSIAQEALALDRLQAELTTSGVATGKLASAQRGYQGSLAATRGATAQAGQQLQDIVISLGSGQRASTVLAQQLPQLAFAFSNVGGAAGAVGRFLSGPWGVALALGSFALGPLIDNLFKTVGAADDVKFASNAMGDAQGILGNVLDITTGKITSQNAALIGLAKAQILVARVQAQTRAAEARRGVQDIQFRETQFSGGMGGGFSLKRRQTDARDVISQQVLTGGLDSNAAVERLENLRKIGRLTDDQFAAAAASVANLGVELQNVKVFGEAEKLLNQTGGRSILKAGKANKGSGRTKGSGAADRLAEFGDDTRDKIANIADQFGDAPNAVTRINKALRQLDDLQNDLQRKKPVNLDQYLAQLKEAKAIVGNSLSTSFDKIVLKQAEQVRIQDLLITGREREARILETLAGLGDLDVRGRVESLNAEIKASAEVLITADATADERTKAADALASARAEHEKIAPLAERQAKWATETADSEIRKAEAARIYGDQVRRLTGIIESTRGGLEDIFSGGKAADFFSTIRQNFVRLRAEMTVESIFGSAFRDLDKQVRRNDPLNREITNFAEQAGVGSKAVTAHANALVNATAAINGTPAANDNPASETNPNGLILVEALKNTDLGLKTATLNSFTRQWAMAVTNPLLSELDRLLGTNFFIGLSGVVSGALEGYVRAGKVGGVLGGAQGVFETLAKRDAKTGIATNKSLGEISDKLGKALGGAQTGDQTAQLLRSVGIKTSRTGGQIGGAIGSALPIPGGEIIGSIIGSVVGGLFKKTKNGATTINGLNDDLAFTGSGKLKAGVLGLGNSVKGSLASIIDQLNGTAGDFAVSVGQRGKNFTVDPTGRGRTKGSDVQKFKTEEEAARAALLDAIADGAVKGITDGARRLLTAGQNLDKQLQKAVSFQSVFDRLKAIDNPLGAALDVLDREFSGLKSIFGEAGATVAEYAQLERLYGIERAAAIKESGERIFGSLRGLYSELTASNDARSLTERLTFAKATFDPLAARVAAGDSTAYDDFAAAARELLDIQRQFSGSQGGYFDLLNKVTDLTRTTIGAGETVNFAAINRESPFTTTGAVANDNGVVGAITDQTSMLMQGINMTNTQIAVTNSLLRQAGGGAGGFSLSGPTYF